MNPVPGQPLTIAMVAGETSGDNLGGPLVKQLQQLSPGSRIFGIGGPAMQAEGFQSLYDMETLSVNGFVDPLLRLPALLRLLYGIRDEIVASKADCFVGIDSNFFNLLLAGMLIKRGVKTVQYVSPTVWAWRQGRVKKMVKKLNLMLTLYPFETDIYQQHGIPVAFVGHPKAEEIGLEDGPDATGSARAALGLNETERVLAILPGSRGSEVKLTGCDFLETAVLLKDQVDRFVIPAANEKRLAQIRLMLTDYPAIANKVLLVSGRSREVMTASDVVLVNSGTATLEAMLLMKPMVMSYRVGRVTYAIVSRLVRTQWFALPNILAQKTLVPEFIQDAAEPSALARAVARQFEHEHREKLLASFKEIHRLLRQGEQPGLAAARAVTRLCREGAFPQMAPGTGSGIEQTSNTRSPGG